MQQTTLCTQCGTKLAVSRDRCPKCRAFVVRLDKAAEAAQSRRFARVAAGIASTFVAIVAALWMTRGAEPAAAVNNPGRPPADPLGARRAAASPVVNVPSPDETAEHAFLDSSAKGAVSYEAGDYASALSKFEEAVQQNPRDAESLSNLGQVLVRMQRVAEAVPYFERAAALNPDRWTYRFNLARALGLLQRWDESIASYRHAQVLFPDDYVTTFNLALAMHKKGDDAAAIEEYKKAIALNPSEASFRMALAISYEQLKKREEAAGQYAEYLRLSPLAADAEQVRARIAQLTVPAPALPPVTPAVPAAGIEQQATGTR